jgi:ABC transporter DrrB family efflux protein
MFLLTSITTLRERRSGTLERLFAIGLGRAEFIGGYALAFGVLAVLQALVAVGYAVWVCGLEVAGDASLLIAAAVVNGLLGTMLGLVASAFARTEFQAVQFMPLLVAPQLLLGGVIVPRDRMPEVLEAISDWLPLSHSISALDLVADRASDTGEVWREIGVVAIFAAAALVLAALTLRRTTR